MLLEAQSHKKTIGHSIAHPAITKKNGSFMENVTYRGGWNILDSVGPNEFFWEGTPPCTVCAVVAWASHTHRWRRRKRRKFGGLNKEMNQD
jgi:hypothetical protein